MKQILMKTNEYWLQVLPQYLGPEREQNTIK
jgi:hypothetical protein